MTFNDLIQSYPGIDRSFKRKQIADLLRYVRHIVTIHRCGIHLLGYPGHKIGTGLWGDLQVDISIRVYSGDTTPAVDLLLPESGI